jgi:hypothetical protein
MDKARWIWAREKALSNLRKHGIAFPEAALVFEDPLHMSRLDPHSDGD